MAFENVQITTTLNAGTPIVGAREDLASGDVVVANLTDITGVTSFQWQIIGRPEYSTVPVSGGPNPWSLGTGATANSWVVDSDSGSVHLDGTYMIQCIVNINTPTETRISTELARVCGPVIPGLYPAPSRQLRKLGMFESLEDTISIINVLGGWSTMINRWLDLLCTFALAPSTWPGYGPATSVSQIDIGDAQIGGSTVGVAQIDHQHALLSPTVVSDVQATPFLGTSLVVAREDHAHVGVHSVNGLYGDVIVAVLTTATGPITQIDLPDTVSAGTSTFAARLDHQHTVLAPTVVLPVTGSVSSLGSSLKFAHEDHAHQGVFSVAGVYGSVSIVSPLRTVSGQNIILENGNNKNLSSAPIATDFDTDNFNYFTIASLPVNTVIPAPSPAPSSSKRGRKITYNITKGGATVTLSFAGGAGGYQFAVAQAGTTGITVTQLDDLWNNMATSQTMKIGFEWNPDGVTTWQAVAIAGPFA